MRYLLVVAHPDDEVLGAGGSIYNWTNNNDEVFVCILSMEARARSGHPGEDELLANSDSAVEILGIKKLIIGHFRNIEMNNEPHIRIVQFIERAIIETQPDIIVTHHPSDTNNDHLHTSLACQAAFRLFQRREGIKAPNELWFMEVPSSTEWSLNSSLNRFTPNLFIEINREGLEKKIEALMEYKGVMHAFPHPRSREALGGLAAFRGAQSGLKYAEAFECVCRRINSTTSKE